MNTPLSSAASVVIVGGGVAGLSCARCLHASGVSFLLLDAGRRVGGRIRTDIREGYRLDRGFQVLQTAYPEARRTLDYPRLALRKFAPGAMVRMRGRFHTLADPLRKPRHFLKTLTAPVGTLADRFRLLRLVHRITAVPIEQLFQGPETTTMAFLRAEGFSRTMIDQFFVPFFGGVCLDRQLRASNRVLKYVLRMFALGDAALPEAGMEEIPRQLDSGLPSEWIQSGVRVRGLTHGRLTVDDGSVLSPRAIVLATEGPEVQRLLGLPTGKSVAETCLYFAAERSRQHHPYLMLDGDGIGPVNNVAIPSCVSPAYAPTGRSLIAAVVLGHHQTDSEGLVDRVRDQLRPWFGGETHGWIHLATYRIQHALPDQSPPTLDPNRCNAMVRPGLFVCGEHLGLPGIQWSMLSGRKAGDAVIDYLMRSF